MSQIKLQTNASGTGAVVLAAPNTNNTVTVNLPDTAGNTGASAVATTDANGNLGLGVTPSAWGSGGKAIEFGSGNGVFSASVGYGQTYLTNNAYYNGIAWIYKNSQASATYVQNLGAHQWFIAPSGTAGNPITFTQAMTLDAAGNLGVGTSSPQARISAGTSTGKKILAFDSGAGSAQSGIGVDMTGEVNQIALFGGLNANSGTIISFGHLNTGTNAYTEKARIDSSGNLLVGATSFPTTVTTTTGFGVGPEGNVSSYCTSNGSAWGRSDAGTVHLFRRGTTSVGSITINSTSTSYNTSSDYRLKHDIAPMQNALQRVQQLKPVTYKWNADNSDGEGFIAHELAEVCPQAVTGEKDAVDADGKPVYQGIDTSFLVATLTAAIQEQQAIITAQQSAIDSLTARIEALEGK